MSIDWAQAAIGLIGSGTIAAAVTAAVNGAFNRRRNDAEAEKAEADAADVLTGKALTMVAVLEAQVGRAQDRVRELDQETNQLRTDLRGATMARRRSIVASGASIAEMSVLSFRPSSSTWVVAPRRSVRSWFVSASSSRTRSWARPT